MTGRVRCLTSCKSSCYDAKLDSSSKLEVAHLTKGTPIQFSTCPLNPKCQGKPSRKPLFNSLGLIAFC